MTEAARMRMLAVSPPMRKAPPPPPCSVSKSNRWRVYFKLLHSLSSLLWLSSYVRSIRPFKVKTCIRESSSKKLGKVADIFTISSNGAFWNMNFSRSLLPFEEELLDYLLALLNGVPDNDILIWKINLCGQLISLGLSLLNHSVMLLKPLLVLLMEHCQECGSAQLQQSFKISVGEQLRGKFPVESCCFRGR